MITYNGFASRGTVTRGQTGLGAFTYVNTGVILVDPIVFNQTGNVTRTYPTFPDGSYANSEWVTYRLLIPASVSVFDSQRATGFLNFNVSNVNGTKVRLIGGYTMTNEREQVNISISGSFDPTAWNDSVLIRRTYNNTQLVIVQKNSFYVMNGTNSCGACLPLYDYCPGLQGTYVASKIDS